MAAQHEIAQRRWFAFAAATWMVLGTLLLVLLTIWNGTPFPTALPREPIGALAFALTWGFVYVLPVWLLLDERRFRKTRHETVGYGSLVLGACSIALLWALVFG